MSGVVCPIRGGHESIPTIDRAIEYAKDHALPLFFLFVIDLDIVGLTEVPAHKKIASQEMANLASFVLLTARIKAEAQGIQAEGITRFGKVTEEIIAFSKEQDATAVVIGQTRTGKEREITSKSLVSELQKSTDAEIILAQVEK